MITLAEAAEKLGLKQLAGAPNLQERIVQGCYIGDLLSWAMGKIEQDDIWITVMGNVNAIAVAVLADAACILLCDGAALDDDARIKAEEQQVAVLQSERRSFELAAELALLLAQ